MMGTAVTAAAVSAAAACEVLHDGLLGAMAAGLKRLHHARFGAEPSLMHAALKATLAVAEGPNYLLALGLLCELLLWVRRVEWGGLLLCYGLWAFSHHYGDHLCVFCAISVVSMSTDALTLANDEMHSSALAVPIITWVLLLTKLGAVASMIYFKDAYV